MKRREALVVLGAAALPIEAQAGGLTPEELTRTGVLADVILPRTDTPGASDAKVHVLISNRTATDSAFASRWRALLAAMPGDPAPAVERAYRANAPEFTLLKNTVLDLYYSTREGLQQELGWNANTYVADFTGCTHPEHQ